MTPAAPLDAMIMKASMPTCSGTDSGVPMAEAMNSDAIVR